MIVLNSIVEVTSYQGRIAALLSVSSPCKGEDEGEGPCPARIFRGRIKIPPPFLCHSERSEEPRIFLGANHRALNHGSTAAKPVAARFGASANPGFFAEPALSEAEGLW